jgi:hypothetical protein
MQQAPVGQCIIVTLVGADTSCSILTVTEYVAAATLVNIPVVLYK